MSFALIVIGLFLLVSAIRGTQQQLVTLVRGDLTGPNNFVYWIMAIFAIGALGYVPKLKPVSTVLLALVIAVLFFKGKGATNGGFFSQLFSQVSQATSNPPAATANPLGSLLSGLSGLNNTGLNNSTTTTLPTVIA